MTEQNPRASRIAVVGAGISGLMAARLLQRKHDVQVFEANDYAGGHAHTVAASVEGNDYWVDTGFIVCNDRNYPNFLGLLQELQVELVSTEMSFSVSNPARNLEYNGHSLNSLFAQRSNLWHGEFHRMLLDILRFNKLARRHDGAGSVGEFIERHRFGAMFRDSYLLPMVASIWSCKPRQADQFPMAMLARFFDNHGLLDLRNRPRWHSIAGGSRSYVKALCADFADRIRLSTPVRGVRRSANGVHLRLDDGSIEFDQVVLACHGDQALALLESPSRAEREILEAFRFQSNAVLLHHDARLMPQRRKAWASWNFLADDRSNERPPVVTYCMNTLQKLRSPRPLLVSLNATDRVDPRSVLAEFSYSHPRYSAETLRAQARRGEICGFDRIHYCGAWWYDGFHEDGVRSAIDVGKRFGVAP